MLRVTAAKSDSLTNSFQPDTSYPTSDSGTLPGVTNIRRHEGVGPKMFWVAVKELCKLSSHCMGTL